MLDSEGDLQPPFPASRRSVHRTGRGGRGSAGRAGAGTGVRGPRTLEPRRSPPAPFTRSERGMGRQRRGPDEAWVFDPLSRTFFYPSHFPSPSPFPPGPVIPASARPGLPLPPPDRGSRAGGDTRGEGHCSPGQSLVMVPNRTCLLLITSFLLQVFILYPTGDLSFSLQKCPLQSPTPAPLSSSLTHFNHIKASNGTFWGW